MISGLILVVYRICPLKLQEFSIKIYCASGNKTISVGIPTGRHDCMAVVPKVRRTVAKVRQKLSWTDKIILIVGPIDRLTYARKYFIFGKFSNNCQIKIFDHCSHRKFSLSSQKIPFLFLKYWYGDFSNCRKGILNPQMKNDWHQHGFVYVRSQS